MKFCLVSETHAGRFKERNAIEICGIKPQFIREHCIFLQIRTLVFFSLIDRCMQVARNTGKFASHIFMMNNSLDFIGRRHTRVPSSFRVIAAEVSHQLM